VHAVFATRRGTLPTVRNLIDLLAEAVSDMSARLAC
jgi:hypothetical protein